MTGKHRTENSGFQNHGKLLDNQKKHHRDTLFLVRERYLPWEQVRYGHILMI
jgi:hypothetical protein